MQRIERERLGRRVRCTSQQNSLRVAYGKRLRSECGQRRRSICGVLLRGQHLFARCAAELVTSRCLLGTLLTQCDELLGCGDLLLQSRHVDCRCDDVSRARPPGCLELEGLLMDLARERPVGQKRRAKEVERVGALDLGCEYVVEKSRRNRGQWEAQSTLARWTESDIDARQHRVANLGAQLLTCRPQRAFRGSQRGAVVVSLLHEAFELIRLEGLPPLRDRLHVGLELLRNTVGRGQLCWPSLDRVMLRRWHLGRLAIRAERGTSRQRQGGRQQKYLRFAGRQPCASLLFASP